MKQVSAWDGYNRSNGEAVTGRTSVSELPDRENGETKRRRTRGGAGENSKGIVMQGSVSGDLFYVFRGWKRVAG